MLTTVAAGRVYHYSYCIGAFGTSGRTFQNPYDIALGSSGKILVLNRGAEGIGQRITVCSMDHDYTGDFGSYGTGDGQFIWPMGIDLDSQENAFVSDDYLNRISVYDSKGAFVSHWGQPGSGEGELNGPAGVAFDQDDNIYIVDCNNSRIQKFTKDGKFLSKWGSPGNGDGEFNMPWGICLDRNGNVYVADWRNDRVQKFSSDGETLLKFEASPAGVGALHRPTDVGCGFGRRRLRDRLGQRTGAGLRSRRSVHNDSGGGRSRAFALGPGLARGEPRRGEGPTQSRPGAGMEVWPANSGEG